MTTVTATSPPVVEEQPTRRSNAGRKTNAERIQRQAAEVRARRRLEAEQRRATRIYADSSPVMLTLLGLSALICVASFTVSFSGLYAAAAWAVGARPVLQAVVPLMLDLTIVTFTLALFVERERGERVRGTWAGIGILSAASAAANVLHSLAVGTGTSPQEVVLGAIIAGGAPILLGVVSDKAAVKVFQAPEEVA